LVSCFWPWSEGDEDEWAQLSCHDFVDNQVRLSLFVLAYFAASPFDFSDGLG
jgi:hypothetical protein